MPEPAPIPDDEPKPDVPPPEDPGEDPDAPPEDPGAPPAEAAVEPRQRLEEFAAGAGLRPHEEAAMRAWLRTERRRVQTAYTPAEWQGLNREMRAYVPH